MMSSLKTLENSLMLLKYFTRKKPNWGVRELAKEAGLSHSVVSRILKTFQKYGFLIQDTESKKYEIGLMFWQYGLFANKNFGFFDDLTPILESIVEQTEESVFITWLNDLEAVCVKKCESEQNLKFDDIEGSKRPLYVGSRGKTIMAYLPKDQQELIIAKGLKTFTENTVSDPNKLRRELDDIKEKGWGYSKGEYIESVFSISVPILNQNEKVLGSIAIAGPQSRINSEKIKRAVHLLNQGKEKIEEHLNFFDTDLTEDLYKK